MAAAPRPASVLPPGTPPSAAPSAGARQWGQLSLCLRLAARGLLARLSIGIGLATVFGSIVVTLVVSRRGPQAPLAAIPDVTASALAWGAGVLLAFAAAAQALRRDRSEGVRDLLLARGGSLRAYAWARVAGLAALLVLLGAGGALVSGVVSALTAARVGLAAQTLQATFAATAYSIAFGVVLAPIALATLGARSRAGGYGWLLVVLVLPELFERWTSRALPDEWRELVSVPGALSALRSALMPPGLDPARALRATLVIAIVAIVAMIAVQREVMKVAREERS